MLIQNTHPNILTRSNISCCWFCFNTSGIKVHDTTFVCVYTFITTVTEWLLIGRGAVTAGFIGHAQEGGRDRLGSAAAVAMAAAHGDTWGCLRVDAAGAGASLAQWRRCTVPIGGILRLQNREQYIQWHFPSHLSRDAAVEGVGSLFPDLPYVQALKKIYLFYAAMGSLSLLHSE